MKADTLTGKRLPLLGLVVFLAATPLLADLYTWTCVLSPGGLAVDPRPTGDSNGNGLLEPGETVDVEPSWGKHPVCHSSFYDICPRPPAAICGTNHAHTGAASPSPGGSLLLDRSAQYTLAFAGSCRANLDCYSLFVPSQIHRPARHWDTTFAETLNGTPSGGTSWRVHVGDSFADVSPSHPFYKPIETLFHNGVTGGCAPPNYCPDGAVTRSEVAILLAKAVARGGANIPASGSVNGQPYECAAGGASLFDDVAPTDPLCRHAHYVAARNIMKACGSNAAFCPAETISRVVMAVFVARAMVAAASDVADPDESIPQTLDGSYSCDPASPNSHFADVPASNSNGFCKFVNFLWFRFVVAGCGPSQYCPAGLVTRDQMAKFLVKAFALTLGSR